MAQIKYCSWCGSDRLTSKIPDGDNLHRLVCEKCGKVHYINPKIVTGCLVVLEQKILLCRRSIEPASGLWNLPAGYLENGESVEQGALRETREEANAEAGIIRLHCVYSIPHVNQVYLIFLAGLPDGHFSPGKETSEVKLFGINEIPWKDIGFTSSVFALEKYLDSLGGSAKTTYVGQYRK